LVETEIGRALRDLDVQLLSHLPGNAQAKGKIERFFRFRHERVLDHNQAVSLEELQSLVGRWVEAYNTQHVHRGTGCTSAQRLLPSVARPLEGNQDDIFCLKDEGIGQGTNWKPSRQSHDGQLARLCGLTRSGP
jgi:hypothetical protein